MLAACGQRLDRGTSPTGPALAGPIGHRVNRNRKQIRRLVRQAGARNVRVFGPVVRGDEREGSDLDLLVDFPVRARGLLPLADLAHRISELLELPVDVAAEDALAPEVAAHALSDAVSLCPEAPDNASTTSRTPSGGSSPPWAHSTPGSPTRRRRVLMIRTRRGSSAASEVLGPYRGTCLPPTVMVVPCWTSGTAPEEASAVRTCRGLMVLVACGAVAVLGACTGADGDEGASAVPTGSVSTEEMEGMLLTADDVEGALADSAGPAQGSGWDVQYLGSGAYPLTGGPECSEAGRKWDVMVEAVPVEAPSYGNQGRVIEQLITDDPETIAMLFDIERTCWMAAAEENPSESPVEVGLGVKEAFALSDSNEGTAPTEYDIFVRDGGVMLTVGIAGEPELTQEDAIAITAAAVDRVR